MVGGTGGQRLQLQSEGSGAGKLWQQGPSPSPDGFFSSPGVTGDRVVVVVVGGMGVPGAERVKGWPPFWRTRMTPMLPPEPEELWLEAEPGELRGGLQIGVL